MHEAALSAVNTLHTQTAMLARSVVDALNDKKISPWEGMQLGMQGFTLASFIMTLMQGMDSGARDDLLYVLEHGTVVLKE